MQTISASAATMQHETIWGWTSDVARAATPRAFPRLEILGEAETMGETLRGPRVVRGVRVSTEPTAGMIAMQNVDEIARGRRMADESRVTCGLVRCNANLGRTWKP